MRRIAVFSDIHGNLPALDAVLADIEASKTDDAYCLGDLVGYGPDPVGVIEALRERGIATVRGNYDDGIGFRRGECGCYYATPQARLDGDASYRFTDAALGDRDHEWLAGLPEHIRLEVEGVRMLLAHGSPRKLNEYLMPDRTDGFLARLAASAGADLICVGHVHVPYHRVVDLGGRLAHYVSSGSVGKPKDGDRRAGWVEVIIGDEAHVGALASADASVAPAGTEGAFVGIVIHRVDYDVDAVVKAMKERGLPERLGEALEPA